MHVINQTSQQSSHIHQTFGQSYEFHVSIGNSWFKKLQYFSVKLSHVWSEKHLCTESKNQLSEKKSLSHI